MKTEYVVGDKVVVLHSDYENFTINKEYEVKQVISDDLIGLMNDLGRDSRVNNEPWAFYYHEVKPAPNGTEQNPLWADGRTLDSVLDNLNYRRNETVDIIVNLWEDILCLKEEVLELKKGCEG